MPLQEFPLQTAGKFLKLTLSYSAGGPNYLTGMQDQRGYYLSAQVVERSGDIETYAMFSGYRHLVEPAGRFSSRKLEELATAALSSSYLHGLIEATLARSCDCLAVPQPSDQIRKS